MSRRCFTNGSIYFYPRSPCGERLEVMEIGVRCPIFLSTLSLRRATTLSVLVCSVGLISIHALLAESDLRSWKLVYGAPYFYPRSPCGERPTKHVKVDMAFLISIHALLAESDVNGIRLIVHIGGFLSTLSLRRATDTSSLMQCQAKFLSTLSLRRATADYGDNEADD